MARNLLKRFENVNEYETVKNSLDEYTVSYVKVGEKKQIMYENDVNTTNGDEED